jgi:hypothetical protein
VNAAVRLGAFAAGVAVLAAGAALAGAALDPRPPGAGDPAAGGGDGHGHAPAAAAPAAATPAGLAVSEGGRTLRLLTPPPRPGAETDLRFRITDAAGAAVRDFDVTHERRMHLIVVRRDGTGFRHLHPAMGADGTWSVPTRFAAAGVHRVFADFSSGGDAATLGADLAVDGTVVHRPLGPPRATADAGGGVAVRLGAGRAAAGEPRALRFAVTAGGRPVRPQPYLGAAGHLVALREGDLAFLHTHPVAAEGAAPGTVAFEATFPSAGRYRLYLQIRVGGVVRTAEFTREVTP